MRRDTLRIRISGGLFENLIDVMILVYIVIIGVGSQVISAFLSNLWCAVIIMLCFLHKLMRRSFHVSGFTFVQFLFVLFGFLSLFWSYDVSVSRERMTTVLLLFVFSSLLYDYLAFEGKEKRYLHMICWGGAIYAIYIFLSYGFGNYLELMVSGNRLGDMFSTFNTNGIGRITAVAAIMNLYVYIDEKRWPYLISFLVCVTAMLGTGSRTALGGFAIGLVAMFLLKKTRKRFVYFLGGALAIVIALFVIQLPAFEFITSRIDQMIFGLSGNNANADNSTLERMELNAVALEQFLQTPITGIGIGASGVLTRRVMGISSYIHNNYLELLCCGGVIGTAL